MFCQHRFEGGTGESEQAEVKFVDGLTAQMFKSVAPDTARDTKRCKLPIRVRTEICRESLMATTVQKLRSPYGPRLEEMKSTQEGQDTKLHRGQRKYIKS